MKKDKITFDDIFEKGLEEKIDNISKKIDKTVEAYKSAINITNIFHSMLGIKKDFPSGGVIFNEKSNYKFSDKVNEILNKKRGTTEGLTTTFKDGVITISGKLDDGDIIQVDFDKMETRKVGKEVKVTMDCSMRALELQLKDSTISALKFQNKQLEIEIDELKAQNNRINELLNETYNSLVNHKEFVKDILKNNYKIKQL